MSNRTISLITSNKRKEKFYEQSFRVKNVDLRLVTQQFEFCELQSLQEIEVLQHKIDQAIKRFYPPFCLDDEGFYIEGLPAFPGTLSTLVIQGMGWSSLLELIKNKTVTIFCNLAFVDSAGQAHIYSKSTSGTLHVTPQIISPANTIFDFFIPEKQKLTLTQCKSSADFLWLFPRDKAIDQLVKSKPFDNEFSRIKNTISTTDYL